METPPTSRPSSPCPAPTGTKSEATPPSISADACVPEVAQQPSAGCTSSICSVPSDASSSRSASPLPPPYNTPTVEPAPVVEEPIPDDIRFAVPADIPYVGGFAIFRGVYSAVATTLAALGDDSWIPFFRIVFLCFGASVASVMDPGPLFIHDTSFVWFLCLSLEVYWIARFLSGPFRYDWVLPVLAVIGYSGFQGWLLLGWALVVPFVMARIIHLAPNNGAGLATLLAILASVVPRMIATLNPVLLIPGVILMALWSTLLFAFAADVCIRSFLDDRTLSVYIERGAFVAYSFARSRRQRLRAQGFEDLSGNFTEWVLENVFAWFAEGDETDRLLFQGRLVAGAMAVFFFLRGEKGAALSHLLVLLALFYTFEQVTALVRRLTSTVFESEPTVVIGSREYMASATSHEAKRLFETFYASPGASAVSYPYAEGPLPAFCSDTGALLGYKDGDEVPADRYYIVQTFDAAIRRSIPVHPELVSQGLSSVAFRSVVELVAAVLGQDVSDLDTLEAINQLYRPLCFYKMTAGIGLTVVSKFAGAVSAVSLYFWGVDPFDPVRTREVASVRLLLRELPAWLERSHTELARDRAMYMQFLVFKDACDIVYTQATYQYLPLAEARSFTALYLNFLRHSSELLGADAAARVRDQPLWVHLTGKPGTGKSVAVQQALRSLAALDGVAYNPANVYTYNSASDYWEGYDTQEHVVMDDLFQVQDTGVRQKEALTIIHIVNNTPMPLNMAFGNKGKTFMQCKYLWSTSNTRLPGDVPVLKIEDPEAVMRRRGLVFEPVEKMSGRDQTRDFRTQTFRLTGGFMASTVARKFCEIRSLPPDTFSGANQLVLSYEEFVAAIVFARKRADTVSNEILGSSDQHEDIAGRVSDLTTRLLAQARHVSYLPAWITARAGEPKTWKQVMAEHPAQVAIITMLIAVVGFFGVKALLSGPREAEALDELSGARAEMPSGSKGDYSEGKFYTVGKTRHKLSRDAGPLEEARYNAFFLGQSSPGDHGLHVESEVHDFISHVLHRCACLVLCEYLVEGTRFAHTMHGVYVAGDMIAMPAHAVNPTATNIQFTLRNVHTQNGVHEPAVFPADIVVRDDKRDVMIFRVPPAFPPCTSVLKHLIEPNDYMRGGLVGTVIMPVIDYTNRYVYTNVGTIRRFNDKPISYVNDLDKVEYVVDDTIAYNMGTVCGDCGSLVLRNANNGPKVYGFHVAGGSTRGQIGVATTLTRRYLTELLSRARPHPRPDLVDLEDMEITVKGKDGESLIKPLVAQVGPLIIQDTPLAVPVVYELRDEARGLSMTLNHRSKLRMTSAGYNEVLGPRVLEPAAQGLIKRDDGPPVSPYAKAAGKFTCGVPHFKLGEPRPSSAFLHAAYPPIAFSRVYTLEEAINGVAGVSGSGLDMSTSAGWPWVRTHQSSRAGKRHLFTGPEGQRVPIPALAHAINQRLEKAKAGIRYPTVYNSCLKDETRPIEKVRAGKTRVICGSPVDYTILIRMFFGSYIDYVQSMGAIGPIAVGVNPHGADWRVVAGRFQTGPRRVIAQGDYEAWDKNRPAEVTLTTTDEINDWYNDGDENALVRRVLMEEVINPHQIVTDRVFMSTDTMPSGFAATSIVNSADNVKIIVDCVSRVLGRNVTHDDLDVTTYGDDNLFMVRDPSFSIEAFARCVKEIYGMNYTGLDKVSAPGPATEETMSFLGRLVHGPAKDAPPFSAPLDEDTIYHIPYYMRTPCSDGKMTTGLNCMFMELVHHGKARYDHFAEHVLAHPEHFNGYVPAAYSVAREQLEYTAGQRTRWQPDDTPGRLVAQVGGADDGATDSSERAEDRPGRTDMVQQMAFTDSVAEHTSAAGASVFPKAITPGPFQHFTLPGVLDRSYLVKKFTWTGASPIDTLLDIVSFPQALFTFPFLVDKLSGFTMMRFGLKITIRLNVNRFYYGKVMASWKPMWSRIDTTDRALRENIYSESGYNHVLVSASTNATETLEIPWVYDLPYVSLVDVFHGDPLWSTAFGSLYLRVLNPLTNLMSGDTPSCEVSVYASFVDPVLAMPAQVAYDVLMPVTSLDLHAQGLGELLGMASGAATGAGEMAAKAGAGLVSTSLERAAPPTGGIISSIMSNPIVDIATGGISSLFGGIGKMFGLNKPTQELLPTMARLDFASDLTNGRGIDLSVKTGFDPSNVVAVDSSLGGAAQDEMEIRRIAMTPCLFRVDTMRAADTVSYDLSFLSSAFSGTDVFPTFLSWAASPFIWARGGLKLALYLTNSQNMTGRLRIRAQPKGVTLDTSYVNDAYQWIVDIQTDTYLSMFLCWPLPSLWHSREHDLWVITYDWVSALSEPNPVLDSPVYINAYIAAAQDFAVAGPWGDTLTTDGVTPTDLGELHAQVNPRADFEKDFTPLHPDMQHFSEVGYTMGECVDSVRTLLHTYHLDRALRTSGTAVTYPYQIIELIAAPFVAGTTDVAMEHWKLGFLAWRGSVRYKIFNMTAESAPMLVYTDSYDPAAGLPSTATPRITSTPCVAAAPHYRQSLDFETPWLQPRFFTLFNEDFSFPYVRGSRERQQYAQVFVPENTITYPTSPDVTTVYGTSVLVFKALGDDASFHTLVGLPKCTLQSRVFPNALTAILPFNGGVQLPPF